MRAQDRLFGQIKFLWREKPAKVRSASFLGRAGKEKKVKTGWEYGCSVYRGLNLDKLKSNRHKIFCRYSGEAAFETTQPRQHWMTLPLNPPLSTVNVWYSGL